MPASVTGRGVVRARASLEMFGVAPLLAWRKRPIQ